MTCNIFLFSFSVLNQYGTRRIFNMESLNLCYNSAVANRNSISDMEVLLDG